MDCELTGGRTCGFGADFLLYTSTNITRARARGGQASARICRALLVLDKVSGGGRLAPQGEVGLQIGDSLLQLCFLFLQLTNSAGHVRSFKLILEFVKFCLQPVASALESLNPKPKADPVLRGEVMLPAFLTELLLGALGAGRGGREQGSAFLGKSCGGREQGKAFLGNVPNGVGAGGFSLGVGRDNA